MHDALRINIKNKVQQNKTSVSELERRAGLKPSTLQNIVLGRSKNPSLDTIMSLARELGCTIDELISPTMDHKFKTTTTEPLIKVIWNETLFKSIINYISEFLTQHSFSSIAINEVLECIKEIYNYSLKAKVQTMDTKFAEWLIERKFLGNKL